MQADKQLAATQQQPNRQEAASDNTNSTVIGLEWCYSSWGFGLSGSVGATVAYFVLATNNDHLIGRRHLGKKDKKRVNLQKNNTNNTEQIRRASDLKRPSTLKKIDTNRWG